MDHNSTTVVMGFTELFGVAIVIAVIGTAYEIRRYHKRYVAERKLFHELCDKGTPPDVVPIETDYWSGRQRINPNDVVRTPSFQKHLEDCRAIMLRTKQS